MMPHPVVIKIGGALLDDEKAARQLMTRIKTLQQHRAVIVVHGGGPMVETMMTGMGLTSEKVDGLRVTPDAHMPVVCGALAGSANKQLCALAIGAGITPTGLSLMDGNMITCQAIASELGAVGQATPNSSVLLELLIGEQFLPVISSIGCSKNGRLLNINADQAATAVAQLMGAELLFLSNVEGVLDEHGQRLATLDKAQLASLVQTGVITDGMKVKTDAALQAALQLKRPVFIGSWHTDPEALLNATTGTKIQPEATKAGDNS
ncbi:acetylglutamate kinase [Salinimonas iocasae]|uniref:Acetylglutamate kinase n=1 Tax=Salinimonas iocasae TaxID=2572577 RepID=A0A5B7YHA7_9ALTE|nr:acetylglutamate kinase [Salinimonas iocasae]QCZ94786.1 acetylglutamate kinase [Salinimonas iocasae]